MWKELPDKQKAEYKKMILAFASLTGVFAQKADDKTALIPIINSKYQETIFQKVFNATAEDIGNTSFDAAINKPAKYLIGIKTFGFNSDSQKVAQFKANLPEWSDILTQIKNNSISDKGELLSKDEINKRNEALYLRLAVLISTLRNERIESSIANLNGFRVEEGESVESVYHVLMPSNKGNKPTISVGEISYSKIDIPKIKVQGCTNARNPQNFSFTDGVHTYKFTAADCQLYMHFNNSEIVQDVWDVSYVEDAYSIFRSIAEEHLEPKERITESYSWKIDVQPYSGWNAFYGVGSKISTKNRKKAVDNLLAEYDYLPRETLSVIKSMLYEYFVPYKQNDEERNRKADLRNKIMGIAYSTEDKGFISGVAGIVFRPVNEMYIPIPDARNFHIKHPDFFGRSIGTFKQEESKKNQLALDKEDREFDLIFEPSGDCLRSFITEDNGKAIESAEKQTILGEWVLRGVFRLKAYEPLTQKKLDKLEINGMRLYKTDKDDGIHLQFIWIDQENLPSDYVGD